MGCLFSAVRHKELVDLVLVLGLLYTLLHHGTDSIAPPRGAVTSTNVLELGEARLRGFQGVFYENAAFGGRTKEKADDIEGCDRIDISATIGLKGVKRVISMKHGAPG
jgi:hypothetical protein